MATHLRHFKFALISVVRGGIGVAKRESTDELESYLHTYKEVPYDGQKGRAYKGSSPELSLVAGQKFKEALEGSFLTETVLAPCDVLCRHIPILTAYGIVRCGMKAL